MMLEYYKPEGYTIIELAQLLDKLATKYPNYKIRMSTEYFEGYWCGKVTDVYIKDKDKMIYLETER